MLIEKMNDKEKSVVLAKLAGWRVLNIQAESGAWLRVLADSENRDMGHRPPLGAGVRREDRDLEPRMIPNLYLQENMHLAWRVMNWAVLRFPVDWRKDFSVLCFHSPEQAQRIWLDTILEIATESHLKYLDLTGGSGSK